MKDYEVIDKSDINIKEELTEMFNKALNVFESEVDFFIDLLESGFTLDDIQKELPEKYEYSKRTLKNYGLI